MSERHPIIAITGSSGAGTSTVTRTFAGIFAREGVKSAVIEGDSFHRYDRKEMKARQAEAEAQGDRHFSHFGVDNNLIGELENLCAIYAKTGQGKARKGQATEGQEVASLHAHVRAEEAPDCRRRAAQRQVTPVMGG